MRGWSSERRPIWAIDTALPDPDELDRATITALPVADRASITALAAAQARLGADALRAAAPRDPTPKLEEATARLVRLRQERVDLGAGTGAYEPTEAGRAVRDLLDARAELLAAEQTAERGRSWRDRHAAKRLLPALVEAARDTQCRWDGLVAPELARLDGKVAQGEAIVERLRADVQRHREVAGGTARQWLDAERTCHALARGLDAYRNQLSGLPRPASTGVPPQAAFRLPSPSPVSRPSAEPEAGLSL